MNQLNNEMQKKTTPSGIPVKPKKPSPTKEEPAKIPAPCAVLTEGRVREIIREEILKREMEKIHLLNEINTLAKKLQDELGSKTYEIDS
jgi:hypothetical protein